jgi:hypothetical protein
MLFELQMREKQKGGAFRRPLKVHRDGDGGRTLR